MWPIYRPKNISNTSPRRPYIHDKEIPLLAEHIYTNVNHPVDPSPWPFLTAFSVCQILLSLLDYLKTGDCLWFFISLFQFSVYTWQWIKNVSAEATYEGMHTECIQRSIQWGMGFFIITEIMFSIGFFWVYFSVSLSPTMWVGGTWPPVHIQCLHPYGIPLFNTVLLLSSGVSITCAHRCLIAGKRYLFDIHLFLTIVLGLMFLNLQLYEYAFSQFTIEDSVYGSSFYLLTGFHGLHVFVGLLFLIICLHATVHRTFTTYHHILFICTTWYWHFVDLVWLFVLVFLYVL